MRRRGGRAISRPGVHATGVAAGRRALAAARIAGHRPDGIGAILGSRGHDEVIHRDDLVVL